MRRIWTLTASALLAAWMLVLAGCTTITRHPVPTDQEVRFVVFGDSQFGSPDIFERLVHEANTLRPHFATGVGDMINGYTDDVPTIRREWERYKKQLEPLTMPFHPVPGNHDVVTPATYRIYGDVWGQDRYYYSYDYGPVHCIVLDSFHNGENDRIMHWQIEWLANDLAEYAERNGGEGSAELASRSIFVFLHSPMWRYAADSEGRKDWETIHELLRRYPVRGVFGGHTHEYVWENRDGIEYVVLNSTGGMPQLNERGGFMHVFLHVSVVGTDVRTAVVKADSVLPVDTVNSEERNRIPRYGLRGGTIRIPKWEPGEPVDTTVSLPVPNSLREERTFHLRWDIARDSGVEVEPRELWLDVPAGETATPEFRIRTASAPSRAQMPRLRLEARNELRTGVVSRDWEARYRDELARAAAGEKLLTTAIPLDKTFTFDTTFALFVPPRTTAARWTGAATIDGRLDEPAWQRATPITDFRQVGTGPAPHATSVRLLYDADYLYVGVWMAEPNPAGLKAAAEGDIPLTWNDDDVELFFDPTMTARDHTRLFQNAAGTRFNAKPVGRPDRYFQSAYDSAIVVGPDHWTMEMRIPWSDIADASAPTPGTTWGFNVWRHRPQSEPARFHWAAESYNQSRYGVLEFE
ncbi:MAG: metallophosphoesterase [Candidatus Sumerlaeia bacterium]|nr:metallophosphoesterase [Candidatus Sumerlaeia bacterium]